jgi:hypothetical protein
MSDIGMNAARLAHLRGVIETDKLSDIAISAAD